MNESNRRNRSISLRPVRCATASLRPVSLKPLAYTLCALFLLFPGAGPADAYPFDEDVLVLELWTELEPAVPISPDTGENAESSGEAPSAEGREDQEREDPNAPQGFELSEEGPLGSREAVERVLEGARIVISAMLYGYQVEYTPLDRARKVEERFVLEPLARIERGDPRLRALDTRTEKGRFYARIRYDMAEHQILRRSSWSSNTIPSVIARGTAPLSEGYRGKFRSFEEAIKQGLRSYLRPREYNKPREIVAKVLFLDPPYTRIDAGGYHSKVRMKLRIEEVVPYGAY